MSNTNDVHMMCGWVSVFIKIYDFCITPTQHTPPPNFVKNEAFLFFPMIIFNAQQYALQCYTTFQVKQKKVNVEDFPEINVDYILDTLNTTSRRPGWAGGRQYSKIQPTTCVCTCLVPDYIINNMCVLKINGNINDKGGVD